MEIKMINQNMPKRVEFFKKSNEKKGAKNISTINSYNKNKKECPIKIFSQTDKLSLSSLFFDLNSKPNNSIIISIISFLSYKDLLQFQRISKKFYSILGSTKTRKEYILHSNIEDDEHLLFYESNININKLKNILVEELVDFNISSKIYKNILSLGNDSKEKNTSYSHVLEEIMRDINRTFYTEKFKNGNGKKMLINILSALAFIRPEIGYCQGMNFIAGALIELIEEEEKIFWIFLSFIDNIDLNLLFLKNMPDYSIRVYQLNYYIKQYFPKLYNHFNKNQINPDIIFSKWILTIFANYLPFNKLYKIWDLFIIDKWKAIFRISMILLGLMYDKIINLELNEFCQYFKSEEIKQKITYKYICEHYRDFKITNKKLTELKELFFVDQIKEKLDDKVQEWEMDQQEFVLIYKKELKNHEIQIKEKIENLQKKIEKINKKCEINNQKYMNQLEIVKNYKLQLETKIEVKAGYEKVFRRNVCKDYINEKDNNNNNNNLNNINIGININVNHNLDNNENNLKNNNNINIINNDNNIYLKNINIINPNQYDLNEAYQINSLDNNNINYNRKISSTSRKEKKSNNTNNKRPSSFKKLSKFNLFNGKTNELDKIQSKINNLDKEIDSINSALIKNYKILDKDKNKLEKSKQKKNEYKKKFDELINNSQKYKNDLLKNLSEKLKLSAKFVSTNKY